MVVAARSMSLPPLSRREKVIQAVATWFAMVIISIPLWDVADMLFHAVSFGSLAELHRWPMGILVGVILIFGMHAEHGIGSIAERYWPAVLIASAFTALLLRSWWRRS